MAVKRVLALFADHVGGRGGPEALEAAGCAGCDGDQVFLVFDLTRNPASKELAGGDSVRGNFAALRWVVRINIVISLATIASMFTMAF